MFIRLSWIFFLDIRLEKLAKTLFYIYMVFLRRNFGFSRNEQKNAVEGDFYMIFQKTTRKSLFFQIKCWWKIIEIEKPCGKMISKFQVHICCRYEVIRHREPSTKRAKCDFFPVKVATKVFVHLLIFNIFRWLKAWKVDKNPFLHIYGAFMQKCCVFAKWTKECWKRWHFTWFFRNHA